MRQQQTASLFSQDLITYLRSRQHQKLKARAVPPRVLPSTQGEIRTRTNMQIVIPAASANFRFLKDSCRIPFFPTRLPVSVTSDLIRIAAGVCARTAGKTLHQFSQLPTPALFALPGFLPRLPVSLRLFTREQSSGRLSLGPKTESFFPSLRTPA